MDCIYRIKKNDWIEKYEPKDKNLLIDEIFYSIYDYKSIVLNVTNEKFKNKAETILGKYRGKKIFYHQYFIDSVINNYDNSYYIFIHNDKEIIGMTRCGVRNQKAELSMVFVLSEYRNKGYSYRMLDKFICFLNKQKDVIKIGLSVEKENIVARKLYKKLNFITECEKYENLIVDNQNKKFHMIYMYLC